MIQIELRSVDPSYLQFLRQFDSHVPTKASRPWLWPLRLDGKDYGIPLTTQDPGAGYPGYLRYGSGSGLNLRYMVPIPQSALLPAAPLSAARQAELAYYEDMEHYIISEAKILHRLSGLNQMHQEWAAHSCDFQELDSVYHHWQPGFEAGHFLYPKEDDSNMPISKNGKTYYTKEQYEQARYNSSALEYAQSRGYDLIRQNSYYKLREHDSMVFTPDGRWFWNSRGLSGGALEFMIYYEDKTLPEAVLALAGEAEQRREQLPERSAVPAAERETPRQAFRPPQRAQDCRQLFGYLCSKRGLEKSVVQEMIRQQRLYQGVMRRRDGSLVRLPEGAPVYNAVFVYRDNQQNMVGAYQRGMTEIPGKPAYKRDVPGSDKQYGWLLASPFEPAAEVRVFEGAIDAASDASLEAVEKGDAWRAEPVDRLSLEGVGYQPLKRYLETHPEVRRIALMLDADSAGRAAAERLGNAVQRDFPGVEVQESLPPFGKDWNEVLTSTRAMEMEQTAQLVYEPEL